MLCFGDSYAGSGKGPSVSLNKKHHHLEDTHSAIIPAGLKPKDLVGIPWRLAFALQSDGWFLRQDIIWHKPNPMPESVTDRCTKSHEYIFLLSKSQSYFYDHKAIQEKANFAQKHAIPTGWDTGDGAHDKRIGNYKNDKRKHSGTDHGANGSGFQGHSGYDHLDDPMIRNKRSVWSVNTKPFTGAHFATFPEDLIRPCILAGCPSGGGSS